MKYYYVEANSFWFVVYTENKKEAYKEGKKTFGIECFLKIREATKKEVEYFQNIKGQNAVYIP